MATSSSAKIDAAMMVQLKDLLRERFGELVLRYIQDGERRIGLLHGAVVEQDFVVVHAESHGLKGSSRNIGANILGNLCGELEQLGKDHNAAGMPALLAAVEQEFAAVCAELKTH